MHAKMQGRPWFDSGTGQSRKKKTTHRHLRVMTWGWGGGGGLPPPLLALECQGRHTCLRKGDGEGTSSDDVGSCVVVLFYTVSEACTGSVN